MKVMEINCFKNKKGRMLLNYYEYEIFTNRRHYYYSNKTKQNKNFDLQQLESFVVPSKLEVKKKVIEYLASV
jgi:hypothetical protein